MQRKTKMTTTDLSTTNNIGKLKVDSKDIETVKGFCSLGSHVDRNGNCDGGEIKIRIGKAHGAYSKLTNVWKSTRISVRTKLRSYVAVIISMLLFQTVLWPLSKVSLKWLKGAHPKWQRKILNVQYCTLERYDKQR